MQWYGVPVNVAMASTKANCNVSGFYQRVARWKVRQQNGSKPAVNTVINVAAKSPAVLSISTTLLSLSLDQQQGMLIDQLPGWCDKKKNKTTLFKRKGLSGSQASTSRIRTKMSDLYYGNRNMPHSLFNNQIVIAKANADMD